jgi:hypothetical protein
VKVVASRPAIETDRATVDASRSGEDISRLALNFRATNNTSPLVVATLAQGVQQDRSGAIQVSGSLPFMTSFSVDGVSTQRVRFGGPSRELFPSVESIEEFKVSSASNNTEFMQVSDITTTTKSGTNTLHGTAFWYFQDSGLSAIDRFAPRDAAGDPIRPEVQSNAFGVSGAAGEQHRALGQWTVGSLNGPRTSVFSLTLGKRIPLAGSSRLRAEIAFSNLFNIENLDVNPSSLNVTSASFSRVTATQTVDQAGPRTIQFALRYSF